MCYERQSKLDRQSRREFKLILAAIVRHQESPDFDPTERFYRPERFKTSQDGPFSHVTAHYSDFYQSDDPQTVETLKTAPSGFSGNPETLVEMVSRVSSR